jgi:hypothetical protein
MFAIGEKDKLDLTALELQCQETIFLSNVRRHVRSYQLDGYHKAKTNLQALQDLYDKVGKLAGGHDPGLAQFSAGLSIRMAAVKDAVGYLEQLTAPSEGVMTAQISDGLERCASQCETAIGKMEASGREPKELVPAVEGARADSETIRVLINCVRLFGCCGGESGVPFNQFLQDLRDIIVQAKEPSSDLSWLADFISSLSIHMNSIVGESNVMLLNDSSWVEPKAASLARSSLFSRKETAVVDKQMLMPFWVAELDFSKEKGFIFRKGQSAQALLLIDATRHNGRVFIVPPESPLFPQLRKTFLSSSLIGSSTQAVVPVVSSSRALAGIKNFINVTPGYAGGFPKPVGIVYLPAAVVQYSGKKGERTEVIFPVEGAQLGSPTPKSMALGSQRVLMF